MGLMSTVVARAREKGDEEEEEGEEKQNPLNAINEGTNTLATAAAAPTPTGKPQASKYRVRPSTHPSHPPMLGKKKKTPI